MVLLYFFINLTTAKYAAGTGNSLNELGKLIKARLCYLFLRCKFGKPL